MSKYETEDHALNALFAAGRSNTPEPRPDFMAQLMTDAQAAIPRAPAPPSPAAPSFFQRFAGLFAASGLSGAAALGLWVGFVMPDIITDTTPFGNAAASITTFLPGADLSVLSE